MNDITNVEVRPWSSFDNAFLSRFSLILKYPDLDAPSRRVLWDRVRTRSPHLTLSTDPLPVTTVPHDGQLRPIVIRHRRARGHRTERAGNQADGEDGPGVGVDAGCGVGERAYCDGVEYECGMSDEVAERDGGWVVCYGRLYWYILIRLSQACQTSHGNGVSSGSTWIALFDIRMTLHWNTTG